MKKIIISLFILMIITSLQAQINYKINENSYQKINISFTFGELKSIDVETEAGKFSRIYIAGCGGSKDIGNPELPVSVNMLEIPIFGDYVLNVYGKDFTIYNAQELGVNYPIYPAQPSISKSHVGKVDFFYNTDCYQTDDFFALPLARFTETGMMRNINLGELRVCPVQYNPVTQEIKVYKTIDVEILFKGTELVKTQSVKELHQSPLFYSFPVINSMKENRAEFSKTPIKYLIVAHSMFRGELEQFIAWKKRKGFLVEIGYTDEDNVGTSTTSISAFIKSHYDSATFDNPAPTFVLLVGDVEQIPTFSGEMGNHPTDLYYFSWSNTGNYFPFCYYGRFSAQNIEHLVPQIEKTLQYEQYTMPDPNYLDKISLISGDDPDYAMTYGNGFVNYATQYYANAQYGYSTVFSYLYPQSSQYSAQIRAEIGAGVGIANYTAHCGTTGWSDPRFSNNDIKDMNNENKYGLMIGNCCESNRFNVSQCFGEALLRAPKKGAVGYIGGSNYTYWDEDYYWAIGFRNICTANPVYDPARLGAYDRLFHTHGENYNYWMTTFGSMIIAGNSAVQTSSTTDFWKRYYWEIYHLMGDPSIMTYLTKPSRMTANVHNLIPFGDSTFTAKVAPYSYCALTDSNRELVSAGFADAEGNITLTFAPMEEHNAYEFAAWAQSYIQYFKTVYSGYVGIEEAPDFSSLQVFPNPTMGELQVFSFQFSVFSIEVFDVYGRKLLSNHLITSSSHHLINISHLPAGLYFIKICTELGEAVKKVVKL